MCRARSIPRRAAARIRAVPCASPPARRTTSSSRKPRPATGWPVRCAPASSPGDSVPGVLRRGRLTALARRLILPVLAVGGLLLGLAVAETIVRIHEAFRSPKKSELGIEDPVRHHRWRASSRGQVRGKEYRTNSLGLRDREYPEAKPPGGVRILLLGDSFTEGWTLDFEDVVAKRIERDLAGRCQRRYEVINGGNASYSPILEYLLLKEIGPRLRPDIVVLNFDMTDVHDDVVRTPLARLDGQNQPVAVPGDRRRDFAQILPPLGSSPVLRALDPVNR